MHQQLHMSSTQNNDGIKSKMKPIEQHIKLAIIVMGCLLSVACESPPKTAPVENAPIKQKEVKPTVAPANLPTPTSAPIESPRAPPIPNADIQALKVGIAMYNNGDYNGAIKKLGNTPEIWSSHNKSLQVSALKYLAFSYCVTSKTQLCRQQFERAIKIDPSFDLLPSEIGHPIWGPVFLKAKKAK